MCGVYRSPPSPRLWTLLRGPVAPWFFSAKETMAGGGEEIHGAGAGGAKGENMEAVLSRGHNEGKS